MAMEFEVVARCSTTRARLSKLKMPHGETDLPTFMPVATQASMKGQTPNQLHELSPDLTLILNNTYHLSLHPGPEILDSAGGSHVYQGWNRNLLTDSGGFQMVSLVKLSQLTEEGVSFANPFDTTQVSLLTPERSIKIQNSIGADIIMQLDDVVSSLTTGERVSEAMYRSVRWLDRCISQHRINQGWEDDNSDPYVNPVSPATRGEKSPQNLFAIIQGGLDPELREACLDQMLDPERMKWLGGYAVGGLSGGEEKDVFWKIVLQCMKRLPEHKPRYCMGVGFAEDILVCAALGADMSDCVYPTRTGRFGVALTPKGLLKLRTPHYLKDFEVIDPNCPCPTCEKGDGVSRSWLALGLTGATGKSETGTGKEMTAGCSISLHNICFQAKLMTQARKAIAKDVYPQFLVDFFHSYFGSTGHFPNWCIDALRAVGVDLIGGIPSGNDDWWTK